MGRSVGNLSLLEKVGQMFIMGIDGTMPTEQVMELIQTYKIGGIMLYENNIQSAEQLLNLVNSLKSMNMGNEIPLFVGIAQESGRANIMPKEIIKLPSLKYIAELSDKNLMYEVANTTAELVKRFGINMNLWPILDLGGAVDGKVLADRCISTNPTITSSYGVQMINGIKDAGVIPVPKYFPGHGGTNAKSSIIIPYTRKSVAKLEQTDLVPFKAAMENGLDAMLVGNINLSKLNLFAPATMSHKVITKLLKEKYAFDGVVIDDDITMTCVDIQYGIKGSSRRAVLAGSDVMIIRDVKKVKQVLEDIAKQIRSGNLDNKEIDARVQKILDLKDKYNLKDEEITEVNIKDINEKLQVLQDRIKNGK